MSERETCPDCGSPLSGDGEEAFCPACLLLHGLEQPADPGSMATLDEPSVPGPVPARGADPEAIGPYRLIRRLGEGGMGVVYLAEQTGELQRQVAIKLVKLGVNSKQVLARFRMEQQSLALMDHPYIARIFDAGIADDGQPYFAMEYIDGEPIVEFCDRRKLPNDDRVRLYMKVCQAVQHAHQRGVIHRDLKPSNILVVETDHGPEPRVIDFGVAKATRQRFLEWSVFTEIGRLVGTPEYMSPEQAGDSEQEVDTRTDVYSLGVVLYELLVGDTPLRSSDLRQAGLEALLKTVREASFPTPSSRLDSLGDARAITAANRSTNQTALTKELRGELDWIVMRALEKDKDRRYGTPGDLAEELQRYLDDEPILAGPPSTAYRVSKWVRRHRLAVAVASMLAAAGVVAFAGVAVGLVKARAAEKEARQQAEIAQATADFLNDDLLTATIPEMEGRDVKVVDLLDRAQGMIDDRFPDAPLTRASIHYTVGFAHAQLSQPDRAQGHLDQAVAIYRTELGDRAPRTLEAACDAGALRVMLGDMDAARAMMGAALNEMRGIGIEPVNRIACERQLIMTFNRDQRYDESVARLRPLLESARRELGPKHEETIFILNDLSVALSGLGETDESLRVAAEAYELHEEVLGEDHAHTLTLGANLATAQLSARENEQARDRFRELLPRFEHKFGEEHRRTWIVMNNLALAEARLGGREGSLEIHRRLIEVKTRKMGARHRTTLVSVYSLGRGLYELKRYDEALPHLREAFEGRVETLGPEAVRTLTAQSMYAATLGLTGRVADALALHREVIDSRAVLDQSPGLIGPVFARYARSLELAGRRADALVALRKAESIFADAGLEPQRDAITARIEELQK